MFKKFMLLTSILIITITLASITPRGLKPAVNAASNDFVAIANIQDLMQFADDVNQGDDFVGQTVKLTANINAVSISDWESIGHIGGSLSAFPRTFAGAFDGNGFVIINLNANAGEYGKLLFGNVTGTIENVNLVGTVTLGGVGFGFHAPSMTEFNTAIGATLTGITSTDEADVTQVINAGLGSNFDNAFDFTITKTEPRNGTHSIANDAFIGVDGEYTVSIKLQNLGTTVGTHTNAIPSTTVTGVIQVFINGGVTEMALGETNTFTASVYKNNGSNVAVLDNTAIVTWSVVDYEGHALAYTSISNAPGKRGELTIDEVETSPFITVTATVAGVSDSIEIFLFLYSQSICPVMPALTKVIATHSMITLPAIDNVTIDEPYDELMVEFGISTEQTTDLSKIIWRTASATTTTTFTSLKANTTYYVYARTKASAIHKSGTLSAPLIVKTKMAPGQEPYTPPGSWLDYTDIVIISCVSAGIAITLVASGTTLLYLKKKRKTEKKA
ncbi:MAG: hypothetical protein LBG88_00080 [Christensenellaceae bacterium]|jgi:hypothetical protein|nr:hypothetical protein [Christensenellaceae bacterium]